MLLMYFLNDFEIVTAAPIIIGITLVFIFHIIIIIIIIIIIFVVVVVVVVVTQTVNDKLSRDDSGKKLSWK
jgi:hypothetical protein